MWRWIKSRCWDKKREMWIQGGCCGERVVVPLLRAVCMGVYSHMRRYGIRWLLGAFALMGYSAWLVWS